MGSIYVLPMMGGVKERTPEIKGATDRPVAPD